ncbi:unnamed protein product [Paramecium pentaurelia]|uniref:Transmembrane protein n=1 Tax=Paramecium pentaurelia TaxID=43138 RepID=A0A8S1XY54_9CILI|nr:unnamed protein product [Paramecium pentaurelia]
MNKFSQTFQQKQLEILYQKEKEQYCYDNFKKIAFLSFIIALIRLISFANQENVAGILITSTILSIILLMSILILKFCQSGTIFCMVFINYLLILHQVHDQQNSNQFILGTNLAIAHTTILLIIDYKLAAINIFIQTIIKLIIAGFLDGKTDMCSIVLSILCPICFISILFSIEKERRLLFLNNNQGNDWHQLLPSVISDPFVLFSFDHNRMCFKYKNSNKIDRFPYCTLEFSQEDNFRQFFRLQHISGVTIEQFVLDRIDKKSKFFDLNQFTLKPSQYDSIDFEETNILLAELYNIDDNFLIVLEQSKQRTQYLQSTKDKLINLIDQHQQIVQNFLKKQATLINLSLQNEISRVQLLYQLKLHHLYFQGKYKISNSFSQANTYFETVSIDYKQIFISIISLFQKAYSDIKLQFDCTDNKFDVIHYKDMPQDFIIQLLQITLRKTTDQRSHIRLILHSKSEIIFIQIICLNSYILLENLNKNMVIKLYLKLHSPDSQIRINDNGINIQLYKDVSQLKYLNKFQEQN